jgi:hypothetical protein
MTAVRPGRPGVVLVQDGGGPVIDRQRRIPQRAVGRGHQRLRHQPQPAALDHLAARHRDEPGEPQPFQLITQVIHREIGEQHGCPAGYMLTQQSRVKVVPVQVRHVQEVDLTVPVPVQAAVVGEDEPRAEVRRVLPRVTQDRPAGSLDMQASMAQTRDLHLTAYCLGAGRQGRASQRPSPHLVTVATPLGRRKSTHKTRLQRIGLAFPRRRAGTTAVRTPRSGTVSTCVNQRDRTAHLMQIGDPHCPAPFSGERVRREVRESHDRGRASREPGRECGTTVHAGFTGDLAGSFRGSRQDPPKGSGS